MLKDIPIRFKSREDILCSALDHVRNGVGEFITLEINLEEAYCEVLIEGIALAVTSTKIHLALKSLLQAKLVRCNGRVLRSDFHSILSVATKSSRNSQLKTWAIELILFGPCSIKHDLAKELYRSRLFLQHPVPIPEGFTYKNPQYLDIAGSLIMNGAILPSIPKDMFDQNTTNPPSTNQNDDAIDLVSLINNLPRYTYTTTKGFAIDPQISSNLHDHQREAVAFLVSRETNDGLGRGLWTLESFIDEQPRYIHSITGTKSSKTEDILGGIFADGMGLGKTLSLLACIISSLHRAEEFISNCFSSDSRGTSSPIPVSSTLIIVPNRMILDGWVAEIAKHFPAEAISVYNYHGANRKLPAISPLPYQVVLSTYDTVASDLSRGGGVLTFFYWYRLILDEAHDIRNLTTQQFKAVANLSASIRWCVTGTPIQNSVMDLASLVAFLRLPELSNPRVFRKYIEGKRNKGNGSSSPDYRNLKLLLKSICLRRCTSSILPLNVSFITHHPQLSQKECKMYDALIELCDRQIKNVANAKSTVGGNKSIFISVLRLRMFCNIGFHGPEGDSLHEIEEQLKPDEVFSLLQESGQDACAECKMDVVFSDPAGRFPDQKGGVKYPLICATCFQRATRDSNDLTPSTGIDAYDDQYQGDPMQGIQIETKSSPHTTDNSNKKKEYPCKIVRLCEDIKQHLENHKCIVFSFWTRSLDVIGNFISEENITYCQIDGTVRPDKRQEALEEFQNNASIRVLLATIGTGAVGLNNLSVASRIHILEPQWNPSVEKQAIGRVVRLGQDKEVTVIRYIVQNTLEGSIQSRQPQKLRFARESGFTSSFSEGQTLDENFRALREMLCPIGTNSASH
ncbi:SNF2 family N-terminal domain-containing protein [Xylariaceae sp. FL0255]|nr:SNF2 family N-terminal domain-containing protein [Xylariaceae sp. FL0255]